MNGKIWTKEEIEYLKSNYANKPNKEIFKMLVGKTMSQLRNKVSLLGLTKTKECFRRCHVCTEEHRKNLSLSHVGYVMSEEQKRKISKSNTGKIRSEEAKRRYSLSKIGDKNPMKNPEISIKVSKALTGRKLLPEVVEKLEYHRKYNPNYGMRGKHHTKESMGKRFNTMKERNSFTRMFGDKNPSKRPEMRENYKEKRKNWITPIRDTKIEIKIQNFLKQLGIEFFTHQYIKIEHGYQCDILIPSMNLVIECDGNYWHKYPIGREIDNIRTSELIEKGFKVLRLWEFEIKEMDLKDFKFKLGKMQHEIEN